MPPKIMNRIINYCVIRQGFSTIKIRERYLFSGNLEKNQPQNEEANTWCKHKNQEKSASSCKEKPAVNVNSYLKEKQFENINGIKCLWIIKKIFIISYRCLLHWKSITITVERHLNSSQTATALRPFYFAVHPDLFGKFPRERVSIFTFTETLKVPLNLKWLLIPTVNVRLLI